MGGRRVGLVFGVWMVFMLLVAVFGVVLNVPLVWGWWGPTIYITPDGSVIPRNAGILNVTDYSYYIFTNDIEYCFIVVQRDNIVLDGVGRTLLGGEGISIQANNVVLQDVKLTFFITPSGSTSYGGAISVSGSNNIISGNTMNYGRGISASGSNNSVSGNTIANLITYIGISASGSNNLVFGNTLTNITSGISASGSNNIVSENTLTDISGVAIEIHGESNNEVSGNKISVCHDGISLSSSSSRVSGNTVVGGTLQLGGGNFAIRPGDISATGSNNIISENTITSEDYGGDISVSGSNNVASKNTINAEYSGGISAFGSNNIVSENTIKNNGLVDRIIVGGSNNIVSENIIIAGGYGGGIHLRGSSNSLVFENIVTDSGGMGIRLENSSNNSVSGNKIAKHSNYGIYLELSSNNVISGNEITESKHLGITLTGSSNNKLFGNRIAKNGDYGILLLTYGPTAWGWLPSSNNFIYHNYFLNNTEQASDQQSLTNIWDDGYPSGGNYWSDYNGTDIFTGPDQDQSGGPDGIGDTPYDIDIIGVPGNYTVIHDRYPLGGIPTPQGNLIAISMEPVQAVWEADLVKDKATDFRITYESTFPKNVTTGILLLLPEFIPNTYIFDHTFEPGNHDFIIGNRHPQSPLFMVRSKPEATFEFIIDPDMSVLETDKKDNTFSNSSKVRDTHGISILFVIVHHEDEPEANRITFLQAQAYMFQARDFLTDAYPVALRDVKFRLAPEPLLVPRGMRWRGVLEELHKRAPAWFSRNDRVVGVVGSTRLWDGTIWTGAGWAGWDTDDFFGPSGTGFTVINGDTAMVKIRYAGSVAHEIGHTYGLGDDYLDPTNPEHAARLAAQIAAGARGIAFCSNAIGYWATKRQEIPSSPSFSSPSFMHGGSPYRWANDTDYDILLRNFTLSGDPEVLLLGGVVFKNGTARFSETLYHISNGTVDIGEGSAGNYYITLLDSLGSTLSRVGFNVTFYVLSEPPTAVDEEYFGFTIRWVKGTSMIQLQDALGNVLATKSVSLNPPSVTVTSPNGGEAFTPGTNYTITWSASDPDDDALTYNVLISNGMDSEPVPIATGLDQTSFTYDFTNLPGGNQYLIYIVANDGVNMGGDSSDGFFTISSFSIDVVTPPQTVPKRSRADYTLNITSYGGFSNPITLSATSPTTDKLVYRWAGGSTIAPIPNNSITTIVEVSVPDVTQTGNHTLVLSGSSDNNTEVAITYLFTYEDNNPPTTTISLSGLQGKHSWYTSEVRVTLSATDDTSRVDKTEYSFDNTTWTIYTAPFTVSVEGTTPVHYKSTDEAGNAETIKTQTINIDKTKPIADAGQDQTINANEILNLDASGSSDNVGIISYEWDFGDGTKATGKTTTHTYTNKGTYTVTLTVKDAAGNTSTDTLTVTVLAPPEVFPIWILGVAIAAIGIGITTATTLLWKKRKP